MRTVRLALILFLISSGAAVWAQSTVSLLDSWVVDGSYATHDATFNVLPGTDRLVLVAISAEKNRTGAMSVASVSLGGETLTEVFNFTVGSASAYHNLHWLGYLLESQIAAVAPGSTLTIDYSNAPSNPFDQPKIHYASYEHVDQFAPLASFGSAASTSTSSLQLDNVIAASAGDRVVGFNVLGQHHEPGSSTSGYTEQTQSIGATNGHASAVYDRPVTSSVTENPSFSSASRTRMAVSAVVLNAAAIPVIDVSPPTQVVNRGSTVVRGSADPITSTELRYSDHQLASSVAYTVTSGPFNGRLEFTSVPGTAIGEFSQADIDAGSLVYVHNVLSTTSDRFSFDVDDGQGNAVFGETFNLAVTTGLPVTILDEWVVDGSYATEDVSFAVRPGTNRIVVVALSAEKNRNGSLSVASVSLGGQALTEVFDFTVGSATAYHNLHWFGYLLESQIELLTDAPLTVSYANAPTNPFDEPKLHFASYQNVDQTNPIGDSGSNASTNTASLPLSGTLTAGDGDKIIGFNVTGQHYAPGVSTAGYAELTQSIGATNGHASAAYERTATASVTENPTFTVATATRMAVSAVVLKAAPAEDNPNAKYAAPLQEDGGTIPVGGTWGTKGGPGTREQPYAISDFWTDTTKLDSELILLDGEYRGRNSMVNPPRNYSGTASQPIYVHALNDGAVLIDGELTETPVGIAGNYYLLEGFDARTTGRQVIGVSGRKSFEAAHHVTLRRIVAYRDPIYGASVEEYILAGANENSHVVGLHETSDVLFEDFAAFGRGRKTIQLYKSNRPIVRRLWARWDGNWPFAGGRQMSLSCAYRSVDSICENVIATAGGSKDTNIMPAEGALGTISIKGQLINDFNYNVGPEGIGSDGTPAQIDAPYGLNIEAAPYLTPATRDPQSINMKLLGSIIYAVPDTRLRTSRGVLFGGTVYPSKGQKTTTIRDVAVYFPVNTAKPFILNACDDDPFEQFPGGCSYSVGDTQAEAPKTYTNLSIIGGGIFDGNAGVWRRSVFGSDWIGTNVEEILEDDVGVDIFTDDGVGASICRRYVDGVLTNEPLWPWPMQDRIEAATARSLWDTADVRADIEAVFGPIPAECLKE